LREQKPLTSTRKKLGHEGSPSYVKGKRDGESKASGLQIRGGGGSDGLLRNNRGKGGGKTLLRSSRVSREGGEWVICGLIDTSGRTEQLPPQSAEKKKEEGKTAKVFEEGGREKKKGKEGSHKQAGVNFSLQLAPEGAGAKTTKYNLQVRKSKLRFYLKKL